MFSCRFVFSTQENRLSRIFALKRDNGVSITDCTVSNPTASGFTYDSSQIMEAFSDPLIIQYHPTPQGSLRARMAIAEYYRIRLGVKVDPEYLFCTSSTSEAYSYLFKLLADPGDETLIPSPGYPLFDYLSDLESIRTIRYPLLYSDATGWAISQNRLGNSISTKTRAIVVVNPNNPTGSYLKRADLELIGTLCREHDCALIADEVFFDYPGPERDAAATSLCSYDGALTFVLNGFSKILGLPQVKVSWIYINGPDQLRREAKARLEFIADTYLSLSIPVDRAVPTLLETSGAIQEQIGLRCNKNEAACCSLIAKHGLEKPLIREGGWYIIVPLPESYHDEDFAIFLLEQENIYVHPGYFYDICDRQCIVLSLLMPEDVFAGAIAKICRVLSVEKQ